MGGLLHLVQREGDWAGPQPAQAPLRCTKCNIPPINGQCTNFVLFDVALKFLSEPKGLTVIVFLCVKRNNSFFCIGAHFVQFCDRNKQLLVKSLQTRSEDVSLDLRIRTGLVSYL